MSVKKPHATIIVKPTNECNLRCKYCYAVTCRDRMSGKENYAGAGHIAAIAMARICT